jgi:hypothetical protein
LGGKAIAAGYVLNLLLAVPEQRNLGANGAAIAPGSLEIELNPVIARGDGDFVDEQRAALIRNDGVEYARVPQIGKRDGAAIISVGDAHGLRYVFEFAGAIVHPHLLLLIAREAAAGEGGPVRSIADDGAVTARDFGKVIPVAARPRQRDIAVLEEQVEVAVVVQVAELGSKAPAAELDSEVTREIRVTEGVALLRHPKIVAL